MNKKLLLRSVIVILLVLPIVMTVFRMWKNDASIYKYRDVPGIKIPIPETVAGQRGFNACISHDGKTIAVAGNEIVSQNIFELKGEVILHLMTMKYSIFAGDSNGGNFREVFQSSDVAGTVLDMVFSPKYSNQLAYIVAEIPQELPKTMQEVMQIAQSPEKRKKSVEIFTNAYQDAGMGKFRKVLYILDTETKSRKELCTLDNRPLPPQTPEEKFLEEKNVNTLTWSPVENVIFYSNRSSITKIDLDGKKTKFYVPSDTTAYIFSNLHCGKNGEVTFLAGVENNTSYKLFCLDKTGKLISSKLVQGFYPGTSYFDESIYALVNDSHIAVTRIDGNIHKAQIRVTSSDFEVNGENERLKFKKTEFSDPSNVQFYYQVKGFLPDTNEFLLVKRRAFKWFAEGEKRVTPLDMQNANAPWVELRKVKNPM